MSKRNLPVDANPQVGQVTRRELTALQCKVDALTELLNGDSRAVAQRLEHLQEQIVTFMRTTFDNLEHERRWLDTYNHVLGNLTCEQMLDDSALMHKAHIRAEEAANLAHGVRAAQHAVHGPHALSLESAMNGADFAAADTRHADRAATHRTAVESNKSKLEELFRYAKTKFGDDGGQVEIP